MSSRLPCSPQRAPRCKATRGIPWRMGWEWVAAAPGGQFGVWLRLCVSTRPPNGGGDGGRRGALSPPALAEVWGRGGRHPVPPTATECSGHGGRWPRRALAGGALGRGALSLVRGECRAEVRMLVSRLLSPLAPSALPGVRPPDLPTGARASRGRGRPAGEALEEGRALGGQGCGHACSVPSVVDGRPLPHAPACS